MKASISFASKAVLGILERGHRIGNAIAHATFYYDDNTNKMRFIDVDTKTRGSSLRRLLMPMSQSYTIRSELSAPPCMSF